MLSNKLYHYTINSKFNVIRDAGFLQRTPLKPDRQEKPVVWLSSNANFENTARKISFNPLTQQQHLMSISEMIEVTGGVIRYVFIDNDINAIRWGDARKEMGLSRKRRDIMLERAECVTADPDDWWVTFSEIDISKAIAVEVCTNITLNGELVWMPVENCSGCDCNNKIVSMTVDDLQKKHSFDINRTWRTAC